MSLCQYIHILNKFLFPLSRVEEYLVKQYGFLMYLAMSALASRATIVAGRSAVTMWVVRIMLLAAHFMFKLKL